MATKFHLPRRRDVVKDGMVERHYSILMRDLESGALAGTLMAAIEHELTFRALKDGLVFNELISSWTDSQSKRLEVTARFKVTPTYYFLELTRE